MAERASLLDYPAAWEVATLGELVDPARGISYGIVQPGQHTEEGVPIVRVGDLHDGRVDAAAPLRVHPTIEQRHARTRLRGGEVLLSLVGTVGLTAIASPALVGWNTARAVAVIPPKPGIDGRWLTLCLRSPTLQEVMAMWCTTTVQATLNLKEVAQLPMPLPPRSVRDGIARMVFALDDKIELNRRMNRTLEELAAALFKSWFVDFDPVQAKIDGRRPVGVPEHVLPLFPTHFEDSELGPIPKGWRVGCVGDLAENLRRGASPADVDPVTPYIGLEHMPRCSITLDDWGTAEAVTSNKFHFRTGEFLFGKLRPYFHKVGVALIDGVCSTDILVVVPKVAAWRTLALGHISSKELVDFTDAGSDGTRMPRTNWERIASWPLAIPDVAVAEAHVEVVQSLLDRMRASVFESRTLAQLRDTLLPALLSGEVTIKQAENAVGEVA